MKNVISFIGFSKSGKTAVISEIVEFLSNKGYKIGVIKHTKDFEIDKKGKDSWRIYSAGADVMVLSPVKMALQVHLNENLSLDRIFEKIPEFFKEHDLIITEGFKREFEKAIAVAKDRRELDELFEVIKKERGSLDGILAIVIGDNDIQHKSENPCEVMVFKPSQIKDLAEFVLRSLGL
ncbi:MAG: molybdopterin-guanine dinucleotide biosynthesis protein B [Archaeoglobus sp.]|nr:molybdopterin-guanine dinucleotide biosynthesis protein B [Archaeoglobus sp.]